MKSAIVTGATGFIGSHLCGELLANAVETTALVRNDGNADRIGGAAILECEMDGYGLLELDGADTFYHLAWEGATEPGREDERIQAKNISRTIEALRAAKRAGCRRFVALGTVYERLVPQMLSETRSRKSDFYILSKRSAHYICQKLAEKLAIEFVWATIFQPIGKYIKKNQMMSYAIDGLIRGEPPEFGPAMEPCDITAVEDIARGLRLLGECSLSRREYYIGSGKPMLMREYLYRAKELLHTETELKIGVRPDDGLRFSFDWYDISPIQRDAGYVPAVGFEQAVLNTVDWIRSGGAL